MPPSSKTTSEPAVDLETIRDQVLTAAAAASDKKATDVVILEVGPLVGITDFFLLLSTANDRQLRAAIEELELKVRARHDRKPLGREGTLEAGWVVLDYGDFVVHAFTSAQRQVYDLERLWSDAPRAEFADSA